MKKKKKRGYLVKCGIDLTEFMDKEIAFEFAKEKAALTGFGVMVCEMDYREILFFVYS